MNVDAWSENDAKTIGDRSEKVELLTRFRRCYNTVDMKKVDIDNCLSCYNIDSDCKVHLSAHIHQHLTNQQICKVNSLKYNKRYKFTPPPIARSLLSIIWKVCRGEIEKGLFCESLIESMDIPLRSIIYKLSAVNNISSKWSEKTSWKFKAEERKSRKKELTSKHCITHFTSNKILGRNSTYRHK